MNPILIFTIVVAIILLFVNTAIFGWRFVEKHTFSEFFVGQVVGEQNGKIPGFKQYIFSYKKRGKPNIVYTRPLWRTKHLKNGALYRIQVFRRRVKGSESTAWAVPILSSKSR